MQPTVLRPIYLCCYEGFKMKDAKLQRLIESKVKPVFDKFNDAAANMSLELSDLSFELNHDKKRQAKNIVDCAIVKAEESS
jgi:hypothetical protein